MRILAISDHIDPIIHSANLAEHARGVAAVISCGDLPYDYLEFVVSMLNVPLFYVLGNHDKPLLESSGNVRHSPEGCIPLDGRIVRLEEWRLAGLSGSPWYSGGPHQHTEAGMRLRAGLLSCRLYAANPFRTPQPTILVSHTPPRGLGDGQDPPHRGFTSFSHFIDRHSPRLWLHGHTHLYGPSPQREYRRGTTRIINCFGHVFLDI